MSFSRAILLFSISILISCASTVTKHKKLVKSKSKEGLTFDQVLIKPINKNPYVDMDSLGYDGTALASSMQSANISASTQYGYNPVVGLAANLAAGLIASSTSASAEQKKKNAPVSQWLDTLQELDWNPIYKKFQSEFSVPCYTDESKVDKQNKNILLIEPLVRMTSNYMALSTIFLVELKNPKNKVLYRNYFHLHSKGLISDIDEINQINLLTSDDAYDYLSDMAVTLVGLVKTDISSTEINRNHTSIRFKTHMGRYYERGTIVEVGEDFITLKTLRGEIKHFPITEML